jgi:hypothetical protein
MIKKQLLFPLLAIALLCAGCGAGGPSSSSAASIPVGTLTAIAVSPTNASIAATTHQQFTATGTYENPSSTHDITSLVGWSSANTSIATISNANGSAGLAAALSSAGTTTVSASYGGKMGSARLTITAATLSSIVVTPANPSIPDGTTQQFTAIGTFSDSTTQDITASVTWSSGTQSVATMSNAAGSKGLATAVNAGSSTISASYGGHSGSTTLTVTAAVLTAIAVTPMSTSIAEGATQQFTATGTYSDGTTQNITTLVVWASSSTSAANVSNVAGSKGLATGIGTGSTTITATLGSIYASTGLSVTGSVTLSLTWNAPTQFLDGSTLNVAADLQSYKLYYGTASQTYTHVVTIANPGTATVTTSLTLASGMYFFVVTAFTTQDNLESGYSNEIVRTIN